jgi:hypothetical protein
LVAILVWLYPPEPLRRILGIEKTGAPTQSQEKPISSLPSFTGSAHEEYLQAINNNGVAEFMDFIESHVEESVYLDLEVGTEQMEQLNQPNLEGNSKVYVLVAAHPSLNYWFEIKMIVEPSDDFFYGPISVAYGQLRGRFRIMGRYGIGTGVSGFELQAQPSP